MRRKFSFLIILTILGVTLFYFYKKNFATKKKNPGVVYYEDGIMVLQDETFDNESEKHDLLMVEFYAPWCGHCQALAPEYKKAAEIIKEKNMSVILAKVDATEETKLAERFEISGFPTILFFEKGKPRMNYEGGRNSHSIINFFKKKTGMNFIEFNSEDELENLKTQNEVLAVLFLKDNQKNIFEVVRNVSTQVGDTNFAFTYNQQLIEKYSGETLIIFKQFDQPKVNYTGDYLSFEEIKKFISDNETPLLMNFDQKFIDTVLNKHLPFIVYISQNSTSYLEQEGVFKKIANKKLQFCYSYKEQDLGSQLVDFLGIKSENLPIIYIISQKNEEIIKYVYDGKFESDQILQWVDKFISGSVKPVYKSQEIPEKNDGPVKILVSKNFNEIVYESEKDVLIEFYAPWCQHCQKLEPIYEALALKLSNNPKIMLAKMDSTENEIEGIPITGFPTLKFWKSSSKTLLNLDLDDLESNTIETYLKNNTSFDWINAKEDL